MPSAASCQPQHPHPQRKPPNQGKDDGKVSSASTDSKLIVQWAGDTRSCNGNSMTVGARGELRRRILHRDRYQSRSALIVTSTRSSQVDAAILMRSTNAMARLPGALNTRPMNVRRPSMCRIPPACDPCRCSCPHASWISINCLGVDALTRGRTFQTSLLMLFDFARTDPCLPCEAGRRGLGTRLNTLEIRKHGECLFYCAQPTEGPRRI